MQNPPSDHQQSFQKASEAKDSGRKVVMISSTARDLPDHRKQLQEACQRLGHFPLMMEHLPASSKDAIRVSLEMVDEADVYIGLIAHRYGYVPEGETTSITTMEYQRAVERDIPRLVFVISQQHPITIDMVEQGDNAARLATFKEKLQTENIVNFYNSPEDLRANAIASLSQLPKDEAAKYRFHSVSPIPVAPIPYIAHPYVLSQAKGLVGRHRELNLLTDWITGQTISIHGRPASLASVRIFNIVAIGGMGKSALTWEWFNKIAPQEWPEMQGRVWWSFYESDARFENFVLRTLAYVSGITMAQAQEIDALDREEMLLQELNKTPYLIVLDGFERELIAYTRLDANRFSDDEYEAKTANWVAGAWGLPAGAEQSFTGQHRLRQAADRRTGQFLRRLSQVNMSRILVSTRLYPFALQNITGQPRPGCFASFLPGLNDDDALGLWREYGVSGSRQSLLPMFARFGNHPLLLQALAGEIARYRPAPGDFDQWQQDRPDFNPFTLPLKQAKTHVMEFALHGLSEAEKEVLQTIAAFRMPTSYETLLAVCTGEDKPCANASELDATLTQLEDRGLLGWDRQHDRYDLHPVVRGVVWSGTAAKEKQGVFTVLQSHFEAAPMVEDYLQVTSLEDLNPAIELYHALIGLGLYDEACDLFYEKLDYATLYRLGANRQRIELLEKLFPKGLERLPLLSAKSNQALICNMLALSYKNNGEPRRSIYYYRSCLKMIWGKKS